MAPIKTTRRYDADRLRVSPLGWIAFVLQIIADILAIVSFSAPGWAFVVAIDHTVGTYGGSVGLWHMCSTPITGYGYEYCELLAGNPDVPAWFKGCQALAVLGLLFSLVGTAVISVYVFVRKYNRNPKLVACLLPTSLMAGIFFSVLAVVFGAQFLRDAIWVRQIVDHKLYYCFGLGIGAGVFNIGVGVTGVFEVLELRK